VVNVQGSNKRNALPLFRTRIKNWGEEQKTTVQQIVSRDKEKSLKYQGNEIKTASSTESREKCVNGKKCIMFRGKRGRIILGGLKGGEALICGLYPGWAI